MDRSTLGKSMDLIIDSAGEDLWPILERLDARGELKESWPVTTRLFLGFAASFFARVTGHISYNITQEKFQELIEDYMAGYLFTLAETHKLNIESTEAMVKYLVLGFTPQFIKCVEGTAKSKDEANKQFFLLTSLFAGMVAIDRNQYGQGRPFNDSIMRDLLQIIHDLATRTVKEFLLGRSKPKPQPSGCLVAVIAPIVLLAYYCIL